jgi:pyruvate/2-oxoglutarate dehydrogenase complex dihydrolipoamide dehydrogenase (E3) component
MMALSNAADRTFRVTSSNHDHRVAAKRVVLDTGSRSARLPIPKLDQTPVLTAESWITLRDLPPRLLILGGSYIALEREQAYQRLGSQVTILQKSDQLAEREDIDVAEALRSALERDGCRVRLNVDVLQVEATEAGVRVHIAGKVVDGSHLFLATGRQPNTDDLGLNTLGVRLDAQGHVEVDEHLVTSIAGLWAAGDSRGGAAFIHTAYDDSGSSNRNSWASAPRSGVASSLRVVHDAGTWPGRNK